jgi:hypothetical protein
MRFLESLLWKLILSITDSYTCNNFVKKLSIFCIHFVPKESNTRKQENEAQDGAWEWGEVWGWEPSDMNELHVMILEKAKLNCQDIEDVLGDYADGELSESVKARVDAHIDECEVCQELRFGYLKTIELASSLKEESPKMPDEVQERLMRSLSERLGIQFA